MIRVEILPNWSSISQCQTELVSSTDWCNLITVCERENCDFLTSHRYTSCLVAMIFNVWVGSMAFLHFHHFSPDTVGITHDKTAAICIASCKAVKNVNLIQHINKTCLSIIWILPLFSNGCSSVTLITKIN